MSDDILIIDCGSLFTKYGVISESKTSDPLLLPSSFIKNSDNFQLESPTFVDRDVFYYPQYFKFPLRDGEIKDFELYFELLNQIIKQYVNQPSISNIVLTEQEVSLGRDREKLTEILFEKFEFENVFLAKKASCAIYEGFTRHSNNSGQGPPQNLTGIVLHSGDSYTSATPVYDGYSIIFPNKQANKYSSSSLVPVGGLKLLLPVLSKVQSHVGQSLKTINFTRWFDISQSDNERSPLDFLEFSQPDQDSNKVKEIINIKYGDDHTEINKKKIIDVMFCDDHNLVNIPTQKCNVIDLIENSLSGIDEELQKQMLSNVVLSGGNTSHIGFAQRVLEKLRAKYPEARVTESENISNFAIWCGAEKMVKTPNFKSRMANKEEYMENGPRIGDMKFF